MLESTEITNPFLINAFTVRPTVYVEMIRRLEKERKRGFLCENNASFYFK